jgi:hypothetical protein
MPCKMFDCSDYDNKSTSASKRLLAIILRCTISSGYNLITAWVSCPSILPSSPLLRYAPGAPVLFRFFLDVNRDG